MKRDLSAWTIYHYLVCFVTLMMVIVGTVQVVNNLVNYLIPGRIQWVTFESIQHRLGPEADEETVQEIYERETQEHRRDMQDRHLRSALNSLALIMVALPVYIYHWRRIARHERPSGPDNGTTPPPSAGY